jgi:hypothetical protein
MGDAVTVSIYPTSWAQAAQMLGVNRSTVYRMRQTLWIEELNVSTWETLKKVRAFTSKRKGGDQVHTYRRFHEINSQFNAD